MTTYRTKSGDTWDSVAREVYGSEYHADALMEANREMLDVFTFSAGTVLSVPALTETQKGLLPPWKCEV